MIKDIIKTLLVVLIALTGVRCTADEDLEGVNPQLSLSTSTMEFGKGGEALSFTIECNGSWSIIPSEQTEWLTLSKESGSGGSEVEVTAGENPTVDQREITLIISSGSVSEVIIVTQVRGDETLSIEEESPYAVAKNFNTLEINIVSNSSWSATTAQTWVKLSQSIGTGDDTITIEVEENTTTSYREAVITFAANLGEECEFKIVQSEGDPYITLGSIADFTYSGGTKYLKVNTNTSWKILDAANIPTWLTLGQTSGNGTTDLMVKVDSHLEREVKEYTLSFDIDDDDKADETCNIYQDKAPLLLVADPTEITFLSGKNSEDITIEKNDEDTWSVVIPEDAQSWLSVSDEDIDGFKLNATAQTEGDPERSAIVTVKYDDTDYATTFAEIKVTQNSVAQDAAAYTISIVDDNTLELNVTGTTFADNQVFTASNFKMSYTNSYNDASLSGDIAISSMTLDSSVKSKVTIELAESFYNTDELTLEMTSGDAITMNDSSVFYPTKGETADVAISYTTYLSEDFETDGTAATAGWQGISNKWNSIGNFYYSNTNTTGNTSSYVACLDPTGGLTDGSDILVIFSSTFDASDIAAGTVLNLSFDYMLTAQPSASFNHQPAFNTVSASDISSYANSFNATTTWANTGWFTVGTSTSVNTWLTQKSTHTVATLYEGTDMRLSLRISNITDVQLFDNFSLDDAVARTN
ncbi:MAG: BACON domain-containing protein [Rikenellaceae bacterium]